LPAVLAWLFRIGAPARAPDAAARLADVGPGV